MGRLFVVTLCLLVGVVVSGAEAIGTINDIVTDRVVAIEAPDVELAAGQRYAVLREGKEVARLEVRTASGICQVVEGTVRKGDRVYRLDAETSVAESADNEAPRQAPETDRATGALREMLLTRGEIELALQGLRQLGEAAAVLPEADVARAEALAPRLFTAAWLLQLESVEARVAASLRQNEQAELANRLVPRSSADDGQRQTDEPILAPIWPEEVPPSLLPKQYGSAALIDPDPRLWGGPGRWGERPVSPAFAGWLLDHDQATLTTKAAPLVRTDFALDDLTVSGRFRISEGEFLFLILRSDVVVKFHADDADEHAGKVSAKFGYDNLRVVDAVSPGTPVRKERWHEFQITLQDNDLKVKLDGEVTIATNITSGIMGRTGKLPQSGQVGIGGFRAAGSFRAIVVEAINAPGRDAMPRFRSSLAYRPLGEPTAMLELPPEQRISLSHHRVESYKESMHPLADGVLTLRGAPYSQFSVTGIDGEHWRASGKLRALRRGSVWFRVNRFLLFGLEILEAQSARENRFPFSVTHTTSTFRDPDESFAGKPLMLDQWYEWEIEYHEPVGVFRLDGETIMMSLTPRERAAEERGPNQLGFSVYVAQVEMQDVQVQKLAAEPMRLDLSDEALARLLAAGLARADELIAELAESEIEAELLAARVLTGERPSRLATGDDYALLAERFRDAHDWPTYLALLKAHATRLDPASEEHKAATRAHELARQKYDIAIETAELGDIGLDGILRVGARPGAMAVAADHLHVWISIPELGKLALYTARERTIARTIPCTNAAQVLIARHDYLLLLADEGRNLLKIATADGRVLEQVRLAKGTALDLAADPRRPQSWLAVNENERGLFHLSQYKVYAIAEENLALTETPAVGMHLAVDPLGRYLYTGFSMPLNMGMQFDPGFLMIMPVRGHLDHLLSYRIQGGELRFFSERPAPGVYGAGIACDPRGRAVTWIAGGGYFDMMDPEAGGPYVPSFKASNIRQLRDVYRTGANVSLVAYSPVRPEMYAYTGALVRIFHTTQHVARGSISLPERIERGRVTQLVVSPDGHELLIAWSGDPGGVYLHRLDPYEPPEGQHGELPAELLLLAPHQIPDRAEVLRAAGEVELAERLLTWCAKEYAFTDVGNRVAAQLLHLQKSPFLPETDELYLLPVEPLVDHQDVPAFQTLELPASPPKRTTGEPTVAADEAEATAWQEALETLRSFRELAVDWPDSWLYMCDQLAGDRPPDGQLLLMAAEVLAGAERPAPASQLAGRVIELGSPVEAALAHVLLADLYEAMDEQAAAIRALSLAVEWQPRNAFLQRRLGDAVAAAGLQNRARQSWLLSYYLYPSQPELRQQLETLKLIPPPAPDSGAIAIAELFREVSPSVVLIKQQMGVGTGFFISRDGLLLSNHHVVGDREEVEVVFADADDQRQHTVMAQVIGSDPRRDMALLRLDPGSRDIQPLVLGGGAAPSTGDRVIAIGNPGMGSQVLAQTLTEGIISNLRRDIGGQTYLQTSAAVNPGNSGGPLVARDGTVLGMITLKAQLDNVGFAIPASILLDFVREQMPH